MKVISIIIPVYNAEKYITDAVLSSLKQPETGEVLLIEDGSTDGSLQVCENLSRKYENVKLLTHADGANKGAGASRNLGIISASFEYIAFLDADDLFKESRFKNDIKQLEEDLSIDGVYGVTGIIFQDDETEFFWMQRRGVRITGVKKYINPENLFTSLLYQRHGTFTTDAILVRKSIFSKTGLFDENLRLHQDTAMWLKMAAVGKLMPGDLKKPIALRRVHSNNRISQLHPNDFTTREQLYKSLYRWSLESNQKMSIIKQIEYKIWRNKFFKYDYWTRIKTQKNSISNVKFSLFKTKFFIGRVIQHPDLIFSKYLFVFLKEAITGNDYAQSLKDDK